VPKDEILDPDPKRKINGRNMKDSFEKNATSQKNRKTKFEHE